MREQIMEMIKALNDNEFDMLMAGINQISFEYGWENKDFDNSELIKAIWNNY